LKDKDKWSFALTYLSEVTPILHIHKNNSTTEDILCIEYNYRVNIL